EQYLGSLRAIGITSEDHDLRFVEDDWESATLGAWGLGWEVWCDGMEVTQFTYFQQAGGFECRPVAAELTYGLERIAMYLQGVDDIYDLVFCTYPDGTKLTYRDVFWQNEREQSEYSFHASDAQRLLRLFDEYEKECQQLVARKLPLPAYDYCLKCSHAFNLLDARGAISVTERQGYILRVRKLAHIATYATPRRLAVIVTAIAKKAPDATRKLVGPPAKAPEAARAGFARKAGVPLDALKVEDDRVVVEQRVRGQTAAEALLPLL